MFRKFLPLFVVVALWLMSAGGCVSVPTSSSPQTGNATPGGSVVPTVTAAGPTTAPAAGLRPIPVANVTVEVGVGSPIPVDAFVSGEWPDLCAQLAQITQRFGGQTINIDLLATAADPACPPDYLGLPFRIAIPINVVQLPAGTYTVTVNGATTTFSAPVTPPGPPPAETPALTPAGEPTVTTPVAPAGAPVTPAPTAAGAAHYQGPNAYRAAPAFDVAYDPVTWQYVEHDGSGRPSQLIHRAMPGCAVWLRAGPVDATQVATVDLAGRHWTLLQVQPKIVQYVSPQDDIAWIFGMLLPEPYAAQAASPCRQAAEQIIDTFKVLPQGRR